MALTTLLILAVLRGFGVELNLFHLVALILAAGLGLDYALFFDHAGDDRDEQLRTLHAMIVCSLTTLLVFSLLALSTIPVLRAIGSTVALGVVSANFVLALLIVRQPTPRARPGMSVIRAGVLALVPHQGGMCLWDEVLDVGRRSRAACARSTTAIRAHPLRRRRTGCTRCTCANTARRRWRCTAACARGRRRAARGPGCSSRCAASSCTSRRIDDLAGPLDCEAEASRAASPAGSTLSASPMRARCSPKAARR